MIKLYKKQVKAIIDLLNSEPCKTRPALQTMRIKRDGYGYITNGYIVIRFKFELEPEPKDDKQEEFIIPVEKFYIWWKSAKTKDYLDEITLCNMHEDNEFEYPKMDLIMKEKRGNSILVSESFIHEPYIDIFTKICGYSDIKIEFMSTHGIYLTSLDEPIDGFFFEINRR